MGPSSKYVNLEQYVPSWAKKKILHEQHGYGGPPWVVHIFGPQVPKVIP